jgi:tetratricopeptide (TPR) repeat protein
MQSEVPSTAVFYKWLGWFEQNRQRVLYGAVAALVLGLIVWFFIWRSGEKQKEAGYALAKTFIPQMTGAPERATPTAYLKVAADYPGSDPAATATLLAATALFDSGKYAEAQAEFDKFARQHRESPFLAEAQLGVAASLEAQGKTSEALTAYKNLVDRRPSDAVIPQAKYAMARIHDSQDKPELAYPLYEDVARTDPFGSLGSYAGMRAEELKAKYPHLAPAPAAAAAAPFVMMTNAPRAATSNAAAPAPKK